MKTGISLEEEFYRDCTIIDLYAEYPSLVGREKYAVATDLALETLESKYSGFLLPFIPYVIVPVDYLRIKSDFDNNERKHYRRIQMSSNIDDLEETDSIASVIYMRSDSIHDVVEASELDNFIRMSLPILSPRLRHRFIQFAYEDMNIMEIAEAEGVDYNIIRISLKRAQEKIAEHIKRQYGITIFNQKEEKRKDDKS